jgi:hypothetical protein
MNPAIILVSQDFNFVTNTITQLNEESFNSVIERSLSSIDFEVLINELIDENIRNITIISDDNMPVIELIEIRKILNTYKDQIHYNFEFGHYLHSEFENR